MLAFGNDNCQGKIKKTIFLLTGIGLLGSGFIAMRKRRRMAANY